MRKMTKITIQRGSEKKVYSMNLSFKEYIVFLRTMKSIKESTPEKEEWTWPEVGVYR